MRALIAVEWTKIVRRRLNHIVLGVLAMLMALMYVLLWLATGLVQDLGVRETNAVSDLRSALFLEETIPFALVLLQGFGMVAALVVVGANVGAEYTWNTARTITAAEPDRWRFLAAKCVALAGAIVVGLMFALAVSIITSAIISVIDGRLDLAFVDGAFLRHSAESFLRLLVSITPYVGLAVLFSIVGGSPTAGIALSIGVAFLEGFVGGMMALAGGWVADIPRYMLDMNADTLALEAGGAFALLLGGEGSDSPLATAIDRPSVWHAAAVLAWWATIFFTLAFVLFQRQDLEYQG